MKCDKCGKEFSERVFGIHIANCKPKATPVHIEEKPAEEAKAEAPAKAVTPAKPVKPAGKAKNE
jgi:hypothetical protein